MNTSFLEPCTKRFKWRAGNNDGEWRAIDVDDLLRIPGDKRNYIWEVRLNLQGVEYDDMPIGSCSGLVIAADDYDTVWRMMNARIDLNDPEYNDLSWSMKLIGTDLIGEPRIISMNYL